MFIYPAVTVVFSMEAACMVLTVQSNLNGLVKACFLEGGRSIAHQCAKLISLCIE